MTTEMQIYNAILALPNLTKVGGAKFVANVIHTSCNNKTHKMRVLFCALKNGWEFSTAQFDMFTLIAWRGLVQITGSYDSVLDQLSEPGNPNAYPLN